MTNQRAYEFDEYSAPIPTLIPNGSVSLDRSYLDADQVSMNILVPTLTTIRRACYSIFRRIRAVFYVINPNPKSRIARSGTRLQSCNLKTHRIDYMYSAGIQTASVSLHQT